MALTIEQKINIGKLSEAYAVADIKKSGYEGGGVDLKLPRKIYLIRTALETIYNLDSSNQYLDLISNYLIALCSKYYLEANAHINSGGSIVPVTPSSSTYLIPITGADFADATHYNDSRVIGKTLVIFWNDVNRYLLSSEWAATATGINITIAGFDATANPTYELFIYIVNP